MSADAGRAAPPRRRPHTPDHRSKPAEPAAPAVRPSAQALKFISVAVAPATLVSALLLWFGRLHSQALMRYLQVPSTVFELTVQDYAIRGFDGLFVPLTVIACGTALLAWLRHVLLALLPAPTLSSATRWLAVLGSVGGLVLVGYAVFAFLVGDAALPAFPEGGGLALAAAAVLLTWSGRALRGAATPGHVAEWCAMFVLAGLGLFWAETGYAVSVGTIRGEQVAAGLATAPDMVLYTEKRLVLNLPGVREVACQKKDDKDDPAFGYRYEGLKLVMRSGDQYLLLPAGWTPGSGSVVVLPRDDKQRLEFTGPGQVRPAATC